MKKTKQHLEIDEVYSSCISNLKSKDKTNFYESLKDSFINKSLEYKEKAEQFKLYEFKENELLSGLEKNGAIMLYKNKLAKLGQPAYKYYKEILSLAPDGICPYCNQVVASTLDHYLPKATYPLFSVTPLNLVPACKDCNKDKGEPKIIDNNDLHLHPYYDYIDDHEWLISKIINKTYPIFSFSVDYKKDWDESLKKRLKNHFKVFKIDRLYSIHAANELNNLRYLKSIVVCNGRSGLVDQIQVMLSSQEKNTWKSAMLRAMLDSNWFLDDGVHLI